MKLRVYAIEDRVNTLGPGERFALWVQGCLKRCPGCMSPESRALTGGREISTEELAQRILKSGRSGVTISGGEPFLQAEALADMITRIRSVKDTGIIIYTGYTLEELQESEDGGVHKLLACCDLLVDGEYIEALNDGKNLRGSSNQRAIPLTSRYEKNAAQYGTENGTVEFIMHEDKIRMVGIPPTGVLKQFQDIIAVE